MDMEVSLRRAAAIQAEIGKMIGQQNVLTQTISLDVYTPDIERAYADQFVASQQRFIQRVDLCKVLFEIRQNIGEVNSTIGVNDILAEIACLDSLITLYNSVAISVTYDVTKDDLQARAARHRERLQTSNLSASSFGFVDEFLSVSSVSPQESEAARATVIELRRERQKLQDQLLALNTNNHITLGQKAQRVLGEVGII
jgi:hypothetical protein